MSAIDLPKPFKPLYAGPADTRLVVSSQAELATALADPTAYAGQPIVLAVSGERPKMFLRSADLASWLPASAEVTLSLQTPQMDGEAAVGATGEVTDAGHRHPTDTSRAPVVHAHTPDDVTGLSSALANKADLVGGLIPANQLPSYVDDVLEYPTLANLPTVGESGKIYLTQDDGHQYRWGGTTYAEISSSLVLGTSASTAFRGDHGQLAYEHTTKVGNLHGLTLADLGVDEADITDLPAKLAAKADLSGGKVPVSQLPTAVIFVELEADLPAAGVAEYVYLVRADNSMRRWNGSQYVAVGGNTGLQLVTDLPAVLQNGTIYVVDGGSTIDDGIWFAVGGTAYHLPPPLSEEPSAAVLQAVLPNATGTLSANATNILTYNGIGSYTMPELSDGDYVTIYACTAGHTLNSDGIRTLRLADGTTLTSLVIEAGALYGVRLEAFQGTYVGVSSASGGSGGSSSVVIVDSLDSTSATSALSANQGRELKSQIDGKAPLSHNHAVVDNLDSTSATSALSANQGRELKSQIDGKAPLSHDHVGLYDAAGSAAAVQADLTAHKQASNPHGLTAALLNTLTTSEITAAISSAINGVLNGAPAALDTLKELADALTDDDTAINAVVASVAAVEAALTAHKGAAADAHAIAAITGLTAALAGKETAGAATAVDTKLTAHTGAVVDAHAIAAITGLTVALAGKETAGAAAAVDTKLTAHKDAAADAHAMSAISGLVTALAGKETAGTAAIVQSNLTDHIALKNPHNLTVADLNGMTATEIATAISTAINAVLDGAPAALDTLKEIASALADDDTAINAVVASIAAVQTALNNHTGATVDAHAMSTITDLLDTLAAKEAAGTAAALLAQHRAEAGAHVNASTSGSGFMSAADKTSLLSLVAATMPPETNPDAYIKTPNGWELRYRYGTSLASAGTGRFVGEKFIRIAVPANGFNDEDDGEYTWDGVRWTQKAGGSDSTVPTDHSSTATTYGVASETEYGHVMLSSETPQPTGTAAVGTSVKAARADHTHAGTSIKTAALYCYTNIVIALTANVWGTIPIGQSGGTGQRSTEADPSNLISVNASNGIVIAAAGSYEIIGSLAVAGGIGALAFAQNGTRVADIACNPAVGTTPPLLARLVLAAGDILTVQAYQHIAPNLPTNANLNLMPDGVGQAAGYKAYMSILITKIA